MQNREYMQELSHQSIRQSHTHNACSIVSYHSYGYLTALLDVRTAASPSFAHVSLHVYVAAKYPVAAGVHVRLSRHVAPAGASWSPATPRAIGFRRARDACPASRSQRTTPSARWAPRTCTRSLRHPFCLSEASTTTVSVALW